VVELCAKLSIENVVDICQSMDSILFFLFQELNNLLACTYMVEKLIIRISRVLRCLSHFNFFKISMERQVK
jgi:hypothetical protein